MYQQSCHVQCITCTPHCISWNDLTGSAESRNKFRISKSSICLFSCILLSSTTLYKMAAAIKRTTLKLGMIPADGIGKEVIPVRLVSLDISQTDWRLTVRLLNELLRLLDLLCPGLSLSRYWPDGKNSTRMERLCLMRLSGE